MTMVMARLRKQPGLFLLRLLIYLMKLRATLGKCHDKIGSNLSGT